MFGLTNLFGMIREVYNEFKWTRDLLRAANDDLEQRLTVKLDDDTAEVPAIEDRSHKGNGHKRVIVNK